MYRETMSAIQDVIARGQFIMGEEVVRFERGFAQYLGVKHCISCGNGTDALEMALEVLGIGQGDEVIVPAFGWVSPAMAVKRSGATPVFVDVELETGNIDVELVHSAITEKTKAIIPIHLYGNPCRIKELRAICDKEGLYLIEDCAQAHGAEVGGVKVGAIGDLAIFSFYPTKNLGAWGDGGAVVINDDKLSERLFALRDYGRVSRHQFEFAGRNSRLDEIQAAVLNVKLKYLDAFNEARRRIAKVYWSQLGFESSLFPENSVFHQFVIKVNDREDFLSKANLKLDLHYPFTIPVALGIAASAPVATALSQTVVSLPFSHSTTELEISYICEHLKSITDQYEI